MRNYLLQFAFALLGAGTATAGPVLQLVPFDGVLTVTAGGTAGWGFTLENSTAYAVFTQALLSDTSNVDFTDFLSPQYTVIGPDGAFAQSFWAQAFDGVAQTGIGAATVHASLLPGDSVPETLMLFYDLYSVSPLDPAFDLLQDGISFGNTMQADVRIDVVAAAAPEPGTLAGLGLGCVLLLLGRWRRPTSSSSVREPSPGPFRRPAYRQRRVWPSRG